MATLLIASPFVHSNALRSRAMIAEVQAQKTLRVSYGQASVSATGVGHRADASDNGCRQVEVSVLHSLCSPLLNLTPADLITAFIEEENDGEAQPADVPQTLQQLEPVSEARSEATEPHQVVPRRSEKVIFTEEKARRMRKENRATQIFHDKWYHSAIASRLATPE